MFTSTLVLTQQPARPPPNRGDACSKAAMIPCKDREVGSIPTVSRLLTVQADVPTGVALPASCFIVQALMMFDMRSQPGSSCRSVRS